MNDSSVVSNLGNGIENVRGGVILNDRSSVAGNEGAGVIADGVGVTMNDQSRISNNEGRGFIVADAFAVLNDESAVMANNGGVSGTGFLALSTAAAPSQETPPKKMEAAFTSPAT